MKALPSLKGLQERLVVDTSEGQVVYLLIVGKKGIYLRLSPSAYYLLSQRSLGIDFETLAQTLSQQGQLISPAEVETAYQKVVTKINEIEANSQFNRSNFFFCITLFPKSIVYPFAVCFSFFFFKPIAYCLLAGITAITVIILQSDFSLNFTIRDFGWGYLLFLGSLLMHELGHASACVRYGAQPGDIGFTIYAIWPAFYSDVSAAWQLKRWQRIVVDLGGVFFQIIVAALYAIFYAFTHWACLKVALVMIAGSCLFSLNPIFKFDGYWVVADSLGVTNLSQQRSRIFRHFLDRLCRRPVNLLPWPPWVIAVLSVYTVLSFAIWGYFMCSLLPILWQEILGYPSLVIALIPKLLNWPVIIDIKNFYSFLGSTFIVTIGLLMLWRLIKLIPVPRLGQRKSEINNNEKF